MLATLAVALGSVIQGISGVGGGFIMVPLLAMIDVGLLPGPFIFATLSLSTLMAWRERRYIDFDNTGWLLAAIVPGALLGGWLLTLISIDQLGLVFGSMVLLAVVISASGVHLPLNRTTAACSGLAAGAMGAASAIGAPVIALLYQNESGPRVPP